MYARIINNKIVEVVSTNFGNIEGIYAYVTKKDLKGKSFEEALLENYNFKLHILNKDEIVKCSKDIKDLIMPGDLIVQNHIYWHEVEKLRENNELRCTDMHLVNANEVTDLFFTDDYGDSFFVVAKKENEESELKLV